jgi:hypothetical protein
MWKPLPRCERMDLNAFRDSLAGAAPPQGLSPALNALWYEARNDWQRAHAIVQDEDDTDNAWIHAYLHRKEGDLSNAGYWYRRAGKPVCKASLDEEWAQLAAHMLSR